MLLQPEVVIQECKKEFALNTVADPDFKLRRGPSFISLVQPAFLPLVISSFSLKIRGWACPPGSFPRSATGMPGHRIVPDANQLHDSFIILLKVGYL